MERWTRKTAPKQVTSAVIADAWRGGLRAWRGELRGPLRENRKQFRGAFVGETKLEEDAAIERLREEALGFLDFYWPGDRVLKIPFDSCEFRD